MEASLQRNKPKKHRLKSKLSSSTVSPLKENILLSCDDSLKMKHEEKLLDDNLQISGSGDLHNSAVNPQTSIVEIPSVQSTDERSMENCSNEIHMQMLPVSNIIEENKSSEICNDNSEKNIEVSVNNVDSIYNQISMKQMKCSTLEEIKEIARDITKVPSQMYPDLKCLQHCEQMHNIVSSQTLVKTYADKYKNKIAIEANHGCKEFFEVIHDLDKHPLMEMVHDYQRAKKSCSQLRSRIKYFKSNLKRKKDSLWKSVKKEASAKGKCEDGYAVCVKHTFTIKELDQIKFNEVITILKEIEESLLSDAFHSYSEELTKLRIEHYIHNLIENEISKENESIPGVSSEKESESLKKCISVLFDSQRQNVQDKHFLEECQTWLIYLVSKLKQNTNFKNNLFLINHVIRCPNGIQNYASQFIQVSINVCETERNEIFECMCAQHVLLALFLILTPIPYREIFLKNIKEATLPDSVDGKFIVLDSDGEEEEIHEMSKDWSDDDISSLLNQIPLRSLFKHFLLDAGDNSELKIKVQSEDKMLKLFAYSTAIIDVLCNGLETYSSENFPLLFESISNQIRHVLLYISEYYTHHVHVTKNTVFQSQSQAVYDKLFFHVVYKIYNFEKIHVWKILPHLPYNHISVKMLWHILWIFFCPGRLEDEIYSEKDVDIKIKDESVQSHFLNHIKPLPLEDILHLLNAVEKIMISSKSEDDFVKFSYTLIFKISILEAQLRKKLSNEGSIILSSVSEMCPFLVSVLLKEINEVDNDIAAHCINLFKKMNLLKWIPDDSDIHFISSWLLSNLTGGKNQLARMILKNMNFGFNTEGSLFLPTDLHKKIAVLVTEAYLLFDANNSNEGLISKGVKQMLQFTSIGSYQKQGDREEFVHWAWNILFSLKLHPLDRKLPPWVQVYDGYIEESDKSNIANLATDCFQPLLSAYENKHPSGCYLMLLMTSEGCSMKSLLNRGLECLSSLIENEQYMAAIKSLYYILPFFVKNSEQLLEDFGFIKAINDLITADLTVMSNITGEPVIGAVLHRIAAMMKYQIYQAGEHTIEYAAPLIKLWMKILMKMLSPSDKNSANTLKNSPKQIYFLLDVLVKISFLNEYTRNCTLDFLSSYCVPMLLAKSTQSSLWTRIFSSDSSVYAILNRNTIPEYPWLAFYVLSSEMKQKNVQDLWLKVQTEMLKQKDASPVSCLKKASDVMKVDLEFLPVYRWALQAVETPASSPVLPLIYQQFFIYYFHRICLPNSQNHTSVGVKYFKSEPQAALLKRIKKHLIEAGNFYKNLVKMSESKSLQSTECSQSNNCDNGFMFNLSLLKLFQAFLLWIDDESLQDSGLCLSALEPKYCPTHLQLILNADQVLNWF